jgi:ribulose-5-phosphate 4-epimerase/fuculose-1-phosphate aldolase
MACNSVITPLVQAYGILHAEGHGDGTLGHVSLRHDDGISFWIKRADLGFDEIESPADFLRLSLSGDVLEGDGPRHSEWPIHAEILARRPEIGSVIHTHSSSAALLSACNRTIEPLTPDGGYFSQAPVPLFRAPKAHIDDRETARNMVESLGSALALLLRNHGLVACGSDVAQATLVTLFLERAARVQIQAASLQIGCEPATPLEASGRAAMLHSSSFVAQTFASYARRLSRSGRNGHSP